MNIRVECDGYAWEFPASIVATNRALYYSEKEEGPERIATYTSEFEYTLKNKTELLDWFQGNMDWEDVEHHAKLVKTPFKLERPETYDDVKVVE